LFTESVRKHRYYAVEQGYAVVAPELTGPEAQWSSPSMTLAPRIPDAEMSDAAPRPQEKGFESRWSNCPNGKVRGGQTRQTLVEAACWYFQSIPRQRSPVIQDADDEYCDAVN
jgi:hypothetical protein